MQARGAGDRLHAVSGPSRWATVPKMGDCAEVTRVSGPPYGRRAFDRVAVGREQQDGAVVDDDLHVAFVVLDA